MSIIGIAISITLSAWWVVHETNSKELEDKIKDLGTGPLSLASILVGLGLLCLRLVSGKPDGIGIDYSVVAFVGFLSVSAGALLVDSVMDLHLNLSFKQRIIFLNGGYSIFCAVMAIVAFALISDALGSKTNTFDYYRTEPLVVAFALFCKAMTKEEEKGISLLMLLMASVYAWGTVWDIVSMVFGIPFYMVIIFIGFIAITVRFTLFKNRPSTN